MPSSDIYKVKNSTPIQEKKASRKSSRRRRRSSREDFDKAVNKDISKTHRRRQKNSGFRRFRHLMKKPEFSKKFWTITISVGVGILVILILWDWFLRYPSADDSEVAVPAIPDYEFETE